MVCIYDDILPDFYGYNADILQSANPYVVRILLNKQLWQILKNIPDANGHLQGVGSGSLEVKIEPPRSRMKPATSR